MRKIILYVSILASVTLFNACELNDVPTFDDANAFVAFTSERISVQEDAEAFVVPVRLTSLKGIATTVSFEIIDSTAVQGVDFELEGGATILSFDGSTAVQNIKFNILPHIGEFTGDRLFGIRIIGSGSVNMGTIKTVYVNIQDIDHPLAAILGEYTVYGPNYFSGRPDTWNVVIEKDLTDVSKVWISNLVVSGTNQKVYGVVNDSKDKIEIPVGQTLATSTTYTSIILEGFDDPDINKADLLPSGSKLTMDLTQSSPVVFTIGLPFGSHIVDVDSWYSIVLAGATFTKK